MPFILIRVCLWLILSGAIIARAKIAKTVRKKPAAIMSVVLCTLLLAASAVFPVENLFVRFSSPESVSRYAIPGRIDDMVYGKDSCLVTCIGRDGTREIWFIPKTKSGYRIPGCFNTKRVSQKFDENGFFIVRRVRGTDDYYVFLTLHLTGGQNEIQVFNGKDDQAARSFYRVKDSGYIYFFLEVFSKETYLLINGEKVMLAD